MKLKWLCDIPGAHFFSGVEEGESGRHAFRGNLKITFAEIGGNEA